MRLYREAIADGSTNSAAYLRSAAARLNDASGGRERAGGGGNAALMAVTEIRRALELNPGSTEGYTLLGRAFFLLPRVEEGMLDELGAGLTPGAEAWQIRYYHAQLLERLGRTDECLAEFRQILIRPDLTPDARRFTQSWFSNLIYKVNAKKVQTLVEQKRFAEARQFAVDAEVQEQDKNVAQNYHQLQDWVNNQEKRSQ